MLDDLYFTEPRFRYHNPDNPGDTGQVLESEVACFVSDTCKRLPIDDVMGAISDALTFRAMELRQLALTSGPTKDGIMWLNQLDDLNEYGAVVRREDFPADWEMEPFIEGNPVVRTIRGVVEVR